MKRTAIFLLLATFAACLLPAYCEEAQKGSWTQILPNLLRFNAGGDNVYLLKSGERGLMFGASEPAVLSRLDETGVKKVDWCFLWNARRDQVTALPAIVSRGIMIGAPSTMTKGDRPPENALLTYNQELWSGFTWRYNAGQVTVDPADIPLFTIKPDYVFPLPKEPPPRDYTPVTWADKTINVFRTITPDRRAMSFVFDVDGKKVAVTGQLLFDGGRFRRLTDIWQMEFWNNEYKPLIDAIPPIEQSVRRLCAEGVELFLPESGEYFDASAARDNIDKMLKRAASLKELLDDPSLESEEARGKAVVPGVSKYDFTGATYIINGGDDTYFVVNAGYPPALESIPAEMGAKAKVQWIFVTDCRDKHSVSAPLLAKNIEAKLIAAPTAAKYLRNPLQYQFPKNSLHEVFDGVSEVADGGEIVWRGARMQFFDLPELGGGRQMMLMITPGSRVLFLGDALVNLRRFPFTQPYYSFDLRESAIKHVLDLIAGLKPTHIADDWGIKEIKPETDLYAAMAWYRKFNAAALDLVNHPADGSKLDPFWCRPVPDMIVSQFGAVLAAAVKLRNYSDAPMKGVLSLRGEFLAFGKDLKIPFEIEPLGDKTIPVEFSIDAAYGNSGTAVGVVINRNGREEMPTQFIVMTQPK
ncbi:MAG: MBL fold metallo-hydrolase [Candidatus Brocadiia bacterium]